MGSQAGESITETFIDMSWGELKADFKDRLQTDMGLLKRTGGL
jgi:hypothetical protein